MLFYSCKLFKAKQLLFCTSLRWSVTEKAFFNQSCMISIFNFRSCSVISLFVFWVVLRTLRVIFYTIAGWMYDEVSNHRLIFFCLRQYCIGSKLVLFCNFIRLSFSWNCTFGHILVYFKKHQDFRVYFIAI